MDRNHHNPNPKSTKREVAECVGMLALMGGAGLAWSGNMTIPHIIGFGTAALNLALPVLMGLAMMLVVVGGLALAVRHRAKVASIATQWRYRNNWAKTLHRYSLTAEKNGTVKVPRIKAVYTAGAVDTVLVKMLPGQTQADFQAALPALINAFGASGGQIQMGTTNPFEEVGLVFSRNPRRGEPRKELAPAPVWAGPLALPSPMPREPLQLNAELWTVSISWARVRVTDNDGYNRFPGRGWGLRVKWGAQWADMAI